MTTEQPDEMSLVRQQRLEQLLQLLAQKGHSQNQVAQRAGVPASYLSDVKKGNRAMTELFARRMAEEFHVDYRWLLGDTGTMDSLELGRTVVDEESTSVWLPLFLHPVRGQPRSLPDWDGACVEVCGAAAARARTATEPYVLHFLADDHAGRLRKHDLVLISQAVNDLAEIQVIRLRRGMFLARKTPAGQWERLAESGPIGDKVEVMGHGLGIVWGSFG
jgi:transcriptional regulator with XRE-family HTH domain